MRVWSTFALSLCSRAIPNETLPFRQGCQGYDTNYDTAHPAQLRESPVFSPGTIPAHEPGESGCNLIVFRATIKPLRRTTRTLELVVCDEEPLDAVTPFPEFAAPKKLPVKNHGGGKNPAT